MKKRVIVAMISSLWITGHSASFKPLNDEEMSKIDGQALLNFSKDNYVYTNTKNQKVEFFKLGLDAEMELNTNIKTLQLGCGGDNGAKKCDIDISNLALSGLPDSYGADGRASSSAKITNPFVEFAIKNEGQASTREVVGFRLGAAQILGLLTAGTENTSNPSDGIQSFSGYMKMAATQGDVNTKKSTFGDSTTEEIKGNLTASILGMEFPRQFKSDSTSSDNKGITVPSINVKFNMPETTISGSRMTVAKVTGITANIESIPLAGSSNMTPEQKAQFANDQLLVTFDPILGLAKKAIFKMGEGSKIQNLNMEIAFLQSLSMVHNIPLTGTGGYLSLQSDTVKWAGTEAEDTALKGWWMSFNNPIQLGYLQAKEEVDISAVLPQVANLVSDFLLDEKNRIQTSTSESLGTLLNTPVTKVLNIDLNTYTTALPATISLSSQILNNQYVTPNCFGGLKFC
ncbi:hypothetical protein [Acinetobacter sp.]|jgi:hypothetical protein|uniref:hypothetical protein n=1 Tax=Acinetobacter sp. TaxID=472 RepID=UPI0035B2C7EB